MDTDNDKTLLRWQHYRKAAEKSINRSVETWKKNSVTT